jgi:hypothetical protein
MARRHFAHSVLNYYAKPAFGFFPFFPIIYISVPGSLVNLIGMNSASIFVAALRRKRSDA